MVKARKVKGSDSLLTEAFVYPFIIQTCKQTYQLIKGVLFLLFSDLVTANPSFFRKGGVHEIPSVHASAD